MLWLVKLGGMQMLADEESSQMRCTKNASQEVYWEKCQATCVE